MLTQLGRIEVDLEDRRVSRALRSVHLWPITAEIARASTRLDVRGDPADELIGATSVVHGVPLVTRDRRLLRSRRIPLARPSKGRSR
jgi:PIN domain nuclease of toxin-antitoxin system